MPDGQRLRQLVELIKDHETPQTESYAKESDYYTAFGRARQRIVPKSQNLDRPLSRELQLSHRRVSKRSNPI